MNPWRWVDSRVGELRVVQARRYLQDRGWLVREQTDAGFIFPEKCLEPDEEPIRQRIPANETAQDYVQTLAYFMTELSELEDRHPRAILEEMLNEDAIIR